MNADAFGTNRPAVIRIARAEFQQVFVMGLIIAIPLRCDAHFINSNSGTLTIGRSPDNTTLMVVGPVYRMHGTR
jgi:hypothetical protein